MTINNEFKTIMLNETFVSPCSEFVLNQKMKWKTVYYYALHHHKTDFNLSQCYLVIKDSKAKCFMDKI